jgi:hypothetical protein
MTLGSALADEILRAIEQDESLAARLRTVLRVPDEPVRPDAPPEKLYERVSAFATRMGWSKRHVERLIREPGFPLVGRGRERRVDVAAARAWLAQRDTRISNAAQNAAARAARRGARVVSPAKGGA